MAKNCTVCDSDFSDGQPWVLLNRYGVGTGRARGLMEVRAEDDGYLWELDENDELETVTSHVMCWPGCASLFIDAKMAEVNVMVPEDTED